MKKILIIVICILLVGCSSIYVSREAYCKDLKYNDWGWEDDMALEDRDFYCYRTATNNEKDYVNQTFVTDKEYRDWIKEMTKVNVCACNNT